VEKAKMKKQKIRLTLKSYDHQLLDNAVKQIVMTVKRTGSQVLGPVPLPSRKQYFTVLRSPHIDKKSREQFELTTHKRILDIVSPAEQTMDALMKLNISAGVDVEIK
jgi:small subunit ribosomal protein S10